MQLADRRRLYLLSSGLDGWVRAVVHQAEVAAGQLSLEAAEISRSVLCSTRRRSMSVRVRRRNGSG